ncbi:hypothetical protein FQN60_006219 [Etheostoma spectabile]|uniref:Uncharacterized protein n=1 Tax=Etheostoma spectabile TaxID=54343 RepID=A0A5J5CKS7_9PERO|nr:hypothetical protein FQN60_006219 [Etheostoma spectabile]
MLREFLQRMILQMSESKQEKFGVILKSVHDRASARRRQKNSPTLLGACSRRLCPPFPGLTSLVKCRPASSSAHACSSRFSFTVAPKDDFENFRAIFAHMRSM